MLLIDRKKTFFSKFYKGKKIHPVPLLITVKYFMPFSQVSQKYIYLFLITNNFT